MPSPTNLPPLAITNVEGSFFVAARSFTNALTREEALLVIHRSNTQPGLLKAIARWVAVSRPKVYLGDPGENADAWEELQAAIAAAEKGVA